MEKYWVVEIGEKFQNGFVNWSSRSEWRESAKDMAERDYLNYKHEYAHSKVWKVRLLQRTDVVVYTTNV